MLIRKPICERWAEEADARKVREMAALVDGGCQTRAVFLSAWEMAASVLAATLRSILPGRR